MILIGIQALKNKDMFTKYGCIFFTPYAAFDLLQVFLILRSNNKNQTFYI